MTACVFNVKKTETVTVDSLAADSSLTDEVNQEMNIYKLWINEDGTRIFDLRDSMGQTFVIVTHDESLAAMTGGQAHETAVKAMKEIDTVIARG